MKQCKSEKTVKEKAKTQGSSRVFIYRIRIIYQELMQGKRNATQLATLLEVSTKTIHRDLNYMRDMLDMEMDSDNTGRTLLDGIHACPICGTGCAGNNPTPTTLRRGMADEIMGRLAA